MALYRMSKHLPDTTREIDKEWTDPGECCRAAEHTRKVQALFGKSENEKAANEGQRSPAVRSSIPAGAVFQCTVGGASPCGWGTERGTSSALEPVRSGMPNHLVVSAGVSQANAAYRQVHQLVPELLQVVRTAGFAIVFGDQALLAIDERRHLVQGSIKRVNGDGEWPRPFGKLF